MLKKTVVLLIGVITLFFFAQEDILAQRVGFLSSQMIREKLPDAKLANQRLQTMVDEWKREINSMEEKITGLDFEIKKNRLIWSDSERYKKEKEYLDLVKRKQKYARDKFQTEYKQIVKEVWQPVEAKIYAAVQQVATKEKFDIIWDQSTQPLPYVNFKYDITLKVLRTLGVDVDALEKELQEKIDKDPRNKESKKRKKKSRRRRRRSRTATKEDVLKEKIEIDKKENINRNLNNNPQQKLKNK